MTQTKPILTFSIEITGSSSQNCWHETVYRVRQLNAPFEANQIRNLDLCGMLGSGQELVYDLSRQEREDSGDGMNFYHVLLAKRICDSGD
jgi:hypothetical protein